MADDTGPVGGDPIPPPPPICPNCLQRHTGACRSNEETPPEG